MNFENLNLEAKAYIFEYDHVLVPQKDYDLQVYYLFCQFIDYMEPHVDSKILLQAIKERYKDYENVGMYEFITENVKLQNDYRKNLALLFEKAQLPLKLLLYKESLSLLNKLVEFKKQVFILTSGNPQTQLNKIRQTEWHGFDNFLKVYFTDEFALKPNPASINALLKQNLLSKEEVIFIGSNNSDKLFAFEANVMYYGISFIF